MLKSRQNSVSTSFKHFQVFEHGFCTVITIAARNKRYHGHHRKTLNYSSDGQVEVEFRATVTVFGYPKVNRQESCIAMCKIHQVLCLLSWMWSGPTMLSGFRPWSYKTLIKHKWTHSLTPIWLCCSHDLGLFFLAYQILTWEVCNSKLGPHSSRDNHLKRE